MTDKTMLAVEITRVGQEHSRHQPRQLPGVGGLQQQVKVIVHHAIVVEAEGEALPVATQQRQKSGFVVGLGEDGLAVVPAVEDMVGRVIGQLQIAGFAGHERTPGGSERKAHFHHNIKRYKHLVPIPFTIPFIPFPFP
jgi:hypothetical protein